MLGHLLIAATIYSVLDLRELFRSGQLIFESDPNFEIP